MGRFVPGRLTKSPATKVGARKLNRSAGPQRQGGTQNRTEVRAGPELDAEIVRKLWRYLVEFDAETGTYLMMSAVGKEAIPPYSTDRAATDQVIEFYQSRGWRLRSHKDGVGYAAAFTRKDGTQYRFICAETLPAAVCHAALAVANGTNIQSKWLIYEG